MSERRSLLLVTDPLYPAAGRRYGDEDVWLAGQLRRTFAVASCSPLDAVALMDHFDAVLVRNSGPVLHYAEAYTEFRDHAARTGARLITDLGARADALGKRYLLDLTRSGAPVIPSIDRHEDLHLLSGAAELMVKPLLGSDSIGISVVPRDQLPADLSGCLVQPVVAIDHEISYVFVDHDFMYAIRSEEGVRWQLQPHDPTTAELEFAQWFVDWNGVVHGVQRVDACRTMDGRLLLVELEDLNPYLSLDVLAADVSDAFVGALVRSIEAAIEGV